MLRVLRLPHVALEHLGILLDLNLSLLVLLPLFHVLDVEVLTSLLDGTLRLGIGGVVIRADFQLCLVVRVFVRFHVLQS